MLTLLGRAVTRTASAVALLALTLGLPAGLLHFVGNPLPSRLPGPGDIIDVVTSPLSDHLLVQSMAALVWLLWLMLLGSVLIEAVAAIRGVTAPRPRLLRPTQGLAATLVAGLTAGIFAPVMVAPLSPAVSAPAPAPAVTLLTATTTTPPVELTAVAYARPLTIPVQAAGKVTLVISDCGYEHTVAKRDNLSRIAATCLGDPDRWPEIYELNKGRYWPKVSGTTKLTSPHLIFPGWVLHLPGDAVAPPDATPVDPPPATADPAPVTPTPSTTTPPPPLAPVSVAPSVTPSTAATTTGAATAAPSQTTVTASPPPQEPTPGRAAPADSRQDPTEGSSFVAVVGGFITAGLAAGLLLAAAMVWQRRRHRYRPTLIDTVNLDDPDLTPPLSGLTHLRQALRRQRPELLEDPKPGPTVREYTAAAADSDTAPTPPVGPTGAELAGLADLPVSAGLGLDGHGALDAARGLLVACLTAGSPDDPDAQGHVVVPASTLATLLGVSVIDLPRMRRLTVTATASDAITHVEEEIIRRTRIMADHDVDAIPELREAHPLAEPVPQLLLIADVPEQRQQQRLANAIHLGEKVDIGAALIGAWDLGVTLTVAADGSATGETDIGQVAVLDTDAATTALTMLAEAHADTPTTPTAEQPTPPAPPADPPTTEQIAATPAPPTAPAAPQSPSANDQRVQVRVLGEPAILGPDGAPMKGLRAKSVELLVYLAVHREGASLSAIMEALWPDATMRRAGERLSTCVGNLRTVLRTAHPGSTGDDSARDNGAADRKGPDPIPNTGSHYHLDPALVHVDLWTVLDEYTQVATADTDARRLRHLDTAIAAISGPLAASRDYDWIDTDREHVRRRLIKLYAHAAHLHTAEPQRVRHLYETACDLDPLNEDLARRAMQASAALDDTNAIRTRLTALRQAVEDNGLDMDEETEQLAHNLLRALATPPRRDDQ
ncbi:transcriptional activator [Micromonospora sp. Llam0]|uniref:BTAD domain-containing putative transcriptional regulator n=1 Tax=Micromonospora sp. Llam0 TaxID=2485143 RepID=UPI000F465CFF|nr:BTAD domain-containing putative transcriptional regulator [Micromonospora sp. Llam0]ROO52729.1 transcriptional activator [Micromonospora sp. Llam0]